MITRAFCNHSNCYGPPPTYQLLCYHQCQAGCCLIPTGQSSGTCGSDCGCDPFS
jgi:hypothetical protein